MPQDQGATLTSRSNELQAKRRLPTEPGQCKGPGTSSHPSGPTSAAPAGVTRVAKMPKMPFEIPSAAEQLQKGSLFPGVPGFTGGSGNK